MKIHIMGRHAHRTPFAYAPYRRLFQSKFEWQPLGKDREVILFGYVLNIDENAELLSKLVKARPDLRLVVVSEEPLWDTTNSGDFQKRHNIRSTGGNKFQYSVINHHTSSVYEFEKFPYFLTTDDEYYLRYAQEFRVNSTLSVQDYLDIWTKAAIKYAFFAENRDLVKKYSIEHPKIETFGLSVYRTDVAKGMPAKGTLRVGQGWGTEVTRQKLPDWHLDKFITLQGNSVVISALENTHQRNYISEKIFDAFACQGVPLYWSSKAHRISELVPAGSFINLFEKTPKKAVETVTSFKASKSFADTYLGAQNALHDRFRYYDTFLDERFGFFERFTTELSTIVTEAPAPLS